MCVTFRQLNHKISVMQIRHFNWLRYQRTINSPGVAKVVQSSVTLSPNKYFLSSHLLTLLLLFLSALRATGLVFKSVDLEEKRLTMASVQIGLKIKMLFTWKYMLF